MNDLMKQVMLNRGYASDYFDSINREPHEIPKDIDRVCALLKYHHDMQSQVVLLTDFDMDGIACGAEGYAGLAELGFKVSLFLPDVTEGYGFNADTIDDLVALYPNVKCIVTADTGITCYEGVVHAKKLGIDIIVTDHHKVKGLLQATVVVDPTRPDDTESFEGMSGSCVLYQVLLYYAKHYATAYHVSQIRRLSVFAGLGTVSDNMPVQYENRRLILDTLNILQYIYNDGSPSGVLGIHGHPVYRRALYGLYALLYEMAEAGNFVLQSKPLELYEDFIGYYIAPMFNAVKRMDADMKMAYDIFFGANQHEAAKALLELNNQRKNMVAEKWQELQDEKYPQPWAPYIYVTDASSGIRGLLAQKVMSQTGQPALVIAQDDDGYWSGSGRCPVWYPFLDAAVSEYWAASGHNAAFGIGFENELCVDMLVEYLKTTIPQLMPEPALLKYQPDFHISMFGDGDVGFDAELFSQYLDELPMMHPFGNMFSEPEGWLDIDTRLVEFGFMGSKKQHLKVFLPMGVTVVCWNQADIVSDYVKKMMPTNDPDDGHVRPYFVSAGLPEKLRVQGKLQYNRYKDEVTIQFTGSLIDIE